MYTQNAECFVFIQSYGFQKTKILITYIKLYLQDGSDSHKKRRRRDGRDSPSDDDGTETYEAEGKTLPQRKYVLV